MKDKDDIPSWVHELYYTAMIFDELLVYHAADDRFVDLDVPERVFDEKWWMYWFETEAVQRRFADELSSKGYDVILAQDTIMEKYGNFVVLSNLGNLF